MRAAPVGVLPTIAQVLASAGVQAAVTHDMAEGVNSARAAALMTHYFLYRLGPKDRLGSFLERHVPGDWATPWQGVVGDRGR
jgi:hypothetical protein